MIQNLTMEEHIEALFAMEIDDTQQHGIDITHHIMILLPQLPMKLATLLEWAMMDIYEEGFMKVDTWTIYHIQLDGLNVVLKT